MSITIRSSAAFGAAQTGLVTVGYQLQNDDGTPNGSRITADIVEQGHGLYSKAVVVLPDAFSGYIIWDTGGGSPLYAFDTYPNAVQLSAEGLDAVAMADISAVPAMTGSLKQAVNWMFALMRNKRTESGSIETLYKTNGSTVVATSDKADDNTTFTRGMYS